MSLVDLGKRLLEAAKLGNTDEVRGLMASGAPFTTDWVSKLNYEPSTVNVVGYIFYRNTLDSIFL